MKRKELIKVVNQRITKIDKVFKHTVKEFSSSGIHKFRLEVKKLRSFITLVTSVDHKTAHLALPGHLRNIYAALGEIRNLQLQQRRIDELPAVQHSTVSESYSEFVSKRIGDSISEAKRLIGGKRLFRKGKSRLRSRIPPRINPGKIRKFIARRLESRPT